MPNSFPRVNFYYFYHLTVLAGSKFTRPTISWLSFHIICLTISRLNPTNRLFEWNWRASPFIDFPSSKALIMANLLSADNCFYFKNSQFAIFFYKIFILVTLVDLVVPLTHSISFFLANFVQFFINLKILSRKRSKQLLLMLIIRI